MDFRDRTNELNTDVSEPPKLDFTRRFIYDAWNKVLQEVERHKTSVLMTPLMMPRERIPRQLSSIAKGEHGHELQGYTDRMPPTDVAAAMIAHSTDHAVIGTAPAGEFPYKLAAVGRVNAMDIFNRAGQPGEIVSRKVQIVP